MNLNWDEFIILAFEATEYVERQEIIEIASVRMNAKSLKVTSHFQTYVQPTYRSELTASFTTRTGILQDMIIDQPHFPKCLQNFQEWMREEELFERKVAFITCGGWPLKEILPAQCRLSRVPIPLFMCEWIDVKKTFTAVTGKLGSDINVMLDILHLKRVGRHSSRLDSIREIRKYSGKIGGEGEHVHVADETHASLRLFRAQRNFYISGFALFFMWVIKRLLSLIAAQAIIMAESVAILRQAESASSHARTLLNLQSASSPSGEAHQNVTNEAHDLELKEFKKKVDSLEQDLMRERKEKTLLRSQVESVNTEFDRMLKEHAKLQEKVEKSDRKKD